MPPVENTMRTGMLALCAGLLTLRFLPVLPETLWLLLIAAAGLLLLPFRTYPLGLFALGMAWACASAHLALNDRLSPQLDGRTLWLEGVVVRLPEHRDGVVRFVLEEATSRRADLPARIRLSWQQGPQVRSGERWRLAVHLKRPRSMLNPGGFDYEAWLLAQRIGATGTIKAGERLQDAHGSRSWRDMLRQRLSAMPAFGREGALIALVLGDGSGLSVADWRILQDTGTVHLMVISGQHIGLIALLIYGAVAGLARIGAWPRALPWLPWACALAMAGALAYGGLAGFEVPVQRACAMLALVLVWRLRFRQLGIWTPILAALLVVLLIEPLASLQAGFWLSFAAVAILLLVFAGRLGAWSWWRSLGRAQWTTALGLLPVLLALALPVSVSGPLANLIAVPWVGLVVVPLALLATLLLPVAPVSELVWWLAGGALALQLQLLEWLAAVMPAWLGSQLPTGAWLLGAIGVVLLMLPSGVPLRLLGLPMVALLILPPREALPEGQAEIWLLDVGQGLAVLVRTREHALLYDAGARFGDFDLGERVVLPALRALGVSRLDRVVISHGDNDHAGGVAAVLNRMPEAVLWTGEPGRLAGLPAHACPHDQRWTWNGVQFRVWQWSGARGGNDASCLLWIEAGGERMLLTGDIGARVETVLIGSGLDLRAEWLQAPHHGSRFSSTPLFIAAVAPEAVLFSRGAHNAFGHPHPLVVERYRQRGARVHDSVTDGALRIRLGTYAPAEPWRAQQRFWREN